MTRVNLSRLGKEIVFADIEPHRTFRSIQPYVASSPEKYKKLSASGQRLERLRFWFELLVFGSFIGIMLLTFAIEPRAMTDAFKQATLLTKSGLVVLFVVALYRLLTRQAFLRWMYKQRR